MWLETKLMTACFVKLPLPALAIVISCSSGMLLVRCAASMYSQSREQATFRATLARISPNVQYGLGTLPSPAAHPAIG